MVNADRLTDHVDASKLLERGASETEDNSAEVLQFASSEEFFILERTPCRFQFHGCLDLRKQLQDTGVIQRNVFTL